MRESMTDDKNNCKSLPCGQLGEGEDDELSMVDVLNEQARLEEHADAVLGDSDAKNCTYPKGYLSRQAIYACATCTPDGNAGVCLACSYACHEGHDLYEIYTKRDFRCDCGNEKFGAKYCKLYADKMEPNSKNKYSQNFRGLYCTCAKPYPDPDDDVDDEMVQCVICEDWLHGRHLKMQLHEPEFTEEMVCPDCMIKLPFLWAYQVQSQVTIVKQSDEASTVNVEEPDVNQTGQPPIASDKEQINGEKPSPQCNTLSAQELNLQNGTERHDENDNSKGCKRPLEESGEDLSNQESVKRPRVSFSACEKSEGSTISPCLLERLQVDQSQPLPDRATFWCDGWREKLCKCDNCLEMYKDKDIEFLLNPADTVLAYEERGKAREENIGEADLLGGLGRVQQIEVVRGIMDMKTQLNEFLQRFAQEGKVVTEADIREFFESMEQQRRRGQVGIPQPFCR